MNFETLAIAVNGRIGRLTLNRPERLNAMNSTMLRELAEAALWLDTRTDVRVVIVRGAGRAFSAGADLKDSSRSEADGDVLLSAFASPEGVEARKAYIERRLERKEKG